MKQFLLGVVVTLVVMGLVGGAYWFGKNQPRSQNSPSPSPSPSLQINQSIEPTPPSATPSSTTESDAQLIKAALFKKNKWSDDSITVTLSTDDGSYASGTVTASGGGGYFYAAKVNGEWQIVADGNGMIFCTSLKDYPNFPKSLIPECYDQTTDSLVKR